MSHGLTTQAVALLFSFAPTLDELREELAPYTPTLYECDGSWPSDNPSLFFSAPDVPDTAVVLDIAHQPWPDDLSQNDYSSDIFLTWKLGNFGPATRPAALSRALTRTFLTHDESQAIRGHKSFIRIRTVSTAPDAPRKNSPIRKPSVACRHLAALDALAIQLLGLPGALAYFNPAGANLLSRNDLLHFTKQAQDLGLENNLVWTNRFFYYVSDHWLFFETLGNHQLYLPDLELSISRRSPEFAGQCRAFLANITLRLINDPQSITSDTVLSGPNDLNYTARFFPTSLTEPDRSVILFLPEGTNELPPEFPKRPNA
jgi:hypothetical protein